MLRSLVAAIGALSVATAAAAQDNCRYEANRSASVSAAGARQLVVEAGSGSLRIEGRPGATQVVVRGRACASSQDLLEQLEFDASRQGNGVRIITREVDSSRFAWSGDRYARLDLVLEVPAGIAADISDGGGAAEIRGLGATRIQDGSGELLIDGIGGTLEIEDGSGEIDVRGVEGDLVIEDGSGEIEVADVSGSVSIEDGSGEITASLVGRNLRISDSSGSIDADQVGGDFIVSRDSSGSIRHRDVRGTVDVPRRNRR